MLRFIFYLMLIFSISFSNDSYLKSYDYDKKVDEYKITSDSGFLVFYFSKTDVLHNYFFPLGYKYGPKGSDFFIDILVSSNTVNDINFVVYEIKRDILKMMCNDKILQKCINFGMSFYFTIHNGPVGDSKYLRDSFVYNKKTKMNCSY